MDTDYCRYCGNPTWRCVCKPSKPDCGYIAFAVLALTLALVIIWGCWKVS